MHLTFVRAPLLLALAGVLLSSCGFPGRAVTCAPVQGFYRIDVEQYTRPATVGSDGYTHC